MSDIRTSPPDRKKTGRSRDRNVNLLKYYGVGAGNGETKQPLDIDGDTFEPNKYFSRLLKENTLSGLVKRDNELVGEIREIDGDMKTLVYENYSKFISATDTIRKMKSNVESMESEMGHLNESMSGITRQSTEIMEALGPNRDKIRRLMNVHNLLKRLQFIFELPDRLGRCLASGHFSQAVKYHAKATRLLNHYQHLAAFKGIERDCEAIIEKIKGEIYKNMRQPNRETDKLAEDIKLLLLLHENPQSLWKEYIDIQMARFDVSTQTFNSIGEFTPAYLIPLEHTVEHFEKLFLTASTAEDEGSSGYDMEEARDDLIKAIMPHLDAFFIQASEYIQPPGTTPDGQQLLDQIRVLNDFVDAVSKHGDALLRIAAADHRMAQLTSKWESELIDGLMCTAPDQLRGRMSRLNEFSVDTIDGLSGEKEALCDFVFETVTWLLQHIQVACLGPLYELMKTRASDSRSGLYLRVRKNVQNMWESLLDIICNTKAKSGAVRRVVGSRLCYDIAEQCIPQVYGNFPKEFVSDTGPQENDPDTPDNLIKSDAGEIIELYTNKSRSLLNEQTSQEGYRLGLLVQKHYLGLGQADKAVSDISQVWCGTLDRLRYIEQLVETLYPQSLSPDGGADTSDTDFEYRFGSATEGLYARPLQSTHSLTTASSETPGELTGLGIMPKFGFDMTVNMMNNIDKLFEDRVDVYRPVEATPVGVCIGLIRVVLKAFLETVRQMRLKQADYQQLQIDAEYLRLMLWHYTQNDNKWMNSMLQEIISSAYTRCNSPIPLKPEELEPILSNYLPS